MISNYSGQLIAPEVGEDVGTPNRAELNELSLDSNYSERNNMGYVNVSVPNDISMNRNYYSTVSLPQTIVEAIDQGQEPLPSAYATQGEHILDKNSAIDQNYNSNVSINVGNLIVGGILHSNEMPIQLPEPAVYSDQVREKPMQMRMKFSFLNREASSLLYSEIPLFLKEYLELAKIYNEAEKSNTAQSQPVMDAMDPSLDQLQKYMIDYKHMATALKKCHICSMCGKSYRTKYSLTTHLLTHQNQRPFECTVCGKTFKSKSTLNTHMSIHAAKKDHICSVCGKRYSKLWLLRQHMLHHGDNHRYHCGHCEKTFAYPYQLKRHEMAIHKGEKPFVCNYDGCEKRFVTKSALSTHQLAHTHPFICTVCNKCFGYQCDLKRHLENKHGIKPTSKE